MGSSEHSNRENISLERNISKKEKMDLLQVSSQMDSDSEETVSNVSDLDQLSPIMASVSVSGQNKDKNDLLVIKQIEEQEETTNLLRGLLGKSTATTVATIQTMRDAAHEVGEISDTDVATRRNKRQNDLSS